MSLYLYIHIRHFHYMLWSMQRSILHRFLNVMYSYLLYFALPYICTVNASVKKYEGMCATAQALRKHAYSNIFKI